MLKRVEFCTEYRLFTFIELPVTYVHLKDLDVCHCGGWPEMPIKEPGSHLIDLIIAAAKHWVYITNLKSFLKNKFK